jgi:hypothetical protein
VRCAKVVQYSRCSSAEPGAVQRVRDLGVEMRWEQGAARRCGGAAGRAAGAGRHVRWWLGARTCDGARAARGRDAEFARRPSRRLGSRSLCLPLGAAPAPRSFAAVQPHGWRWRGARRRSSACCDSAKAASGAWLCAGRRAALPARRRARRCACASGGCLQLPPPSSPFPHPTPSPSWCVPAPRSTKRPLWRRAWRRAASSNRRTDTFAAVRRRGPQPELRDGPRRCLAHLPDAVLCSSQERTRRYQGPPVQGASLQKRRGRCGAWAWAWAAAVCVSRQASSSRLPGRVPGYCVCSARRRAVTVAGRS